MSAKTPSRYKASPRLRKRTVRTGGVPCFREFGVTDRSAGVLYGSVLQSHIVIPGRQQQWKSGFSDYILLLGHPVILLPV